MSESDLREIRLQKLDRLRELGHDPFAQERFDSSHTAKDLVDKFEEIGENEVSFAGRIVAYRPMGKAGFAHLSDGDHKVQIYARRDELGDLFEVFELMDIGDHLGVTGKMMLTKTGEKTIHVSTMTPLSKALHTLPIGKEKDGHTWYGLSDPELRYRHRHLDLITNPVARKQLLDRSRIISSVRRYFDSSGYVEVETPMLQIEAGGAAARPFLTHYNAYEMQVKLRISLELYLKRIICGDVSKVYEIGRVFRNEGVSNRHNPEFTLLEFYEAYCNLEDIMVRVEEVFKYVCLDVFGTTHIQVHPDSPTIDFSQPWKRVDLLSEIERLAGVKRDELASLDTAKKALERCGLPSEKENNIGGIIEKLLERFVEPTLQEPTFVVGYPIETSPLAKKDPSNPKFTRRFEGYVLGREVCNAFSEINDPIDQRSRFEFQLGEREAGDEEAHPMDEEFIYALESGMPPTGGCGIGMDRMAMLLTGAEHLREILLFPMMRPEHEHPEEETASE